MPNKPKHEHSDRDRIYTPERIVKELIKKIPAGIEDIWCDCCFGKGAFYNNFPTDKKEFYEIDMGKDFLTSKKKYDWVVTNIPFSKPKEFIFKMAEASIKGFGILCLANSMTAMRIKKLEKQGFYLDSVTILYIKDWGFGYRTDFYVFTRNKADNLDVMISEKDEGVDLTQAPAGSLNSDLTTPLRSVQMPLLEALR